MEGLGKQWRKEGRRTERAHAQINSRKHEALPCRFACLLGANRPPSLSLPTVLPALSPSPEKREQLYFSCTPAHLYSLSPSRSRHYGGPRKKIQYHLQKLRRKEKNRAKNVTKNPTFPGMEIFSGSLLQALSQKL